MNPSAFLKSLLLALVLLAVARVPAAGIAPVAVPAINLKVAGTSDELMALERTKWDWFFGSPAQRQALRAMFADEFVAVEYSPTGPARHEQSRDPAAAKAHNDSVPELPAGSFKVTAEKALPLGEHSVVLSYVATGEFPAGVPWSAFACSTWVRRNGQWKSVFYQATRRPTATKAVPPAAEAEIPHLNLAVKGTNEELLALERTKVDYIFGTPAQKQAARHMFAKEFVGVGYGPQGPERNEYAHVAANMDQFPNLPPGTFKLTDERVLPAGENAVMISYVVSGPGPDGTPWSAFLTSMWVRRHGEWQTYYYQATQI